MRRIVQAKSAVMMGVVGAVAFAPKVNPVIKAPAFRAVRPIVKTKCVVMMVAEAPVVPALTEAVWGGSAWEVVHPIVKGSRVGAMAAVEAAAPVIQVPHVMQGPASPQTQTVLMRGALPTPLGTHRTLAVPACPLSLKVKTVKRAVRLDLQRGPWHHGSSYS